MPATHPEPASMEDQHVEEGQTANVPTSGPVTAVPSSTPPSPTTAVSMASTDNSVMSLYSPAEASPAKPAVASPTISETSPAGLRIASASDSAAYAASVSKSTAVDFAWPNPDDELPNTLTCKGVRVTLENDRVWKQFFSCGTEMVITKPGRRMFPYCRYRLAGLDPERYYSLLLSIAPSDKYKYRWNSPNWEVVGPAEYQTQVPARAFAHHYSPCRGSDLMSYMLSFYKLKVTNNTKDPEGHIILTSMHRYIPQLHVIPLLDDTTPPLVVGPDSMTFTFPQTEFMAVTTYQNFLVTQLKINYNPFAKGFREERAGSHLGSIPFEMMQLNMEELSESKPMDQSPLSADSAYLATEQEASLVLKPITISPTLNHKSVTQQGRQALGELMLVRKRPLMNADDDVDVDESPSKRLHMETPQTSSLSSAPTVQRTFHRNNRNGRWRSLEGRWNLATPWPSACGRPTESVATEPELDEVEGLTFVSFATREDLESHIRAEPPSKTTPISPQSSLMTPTQQMETEEAVPVTAEEKTPETIENKISRLEAILLQDLKVAKHRQVIHPVLQEVGLKLSSLDPSMPIDLLYLGVRLPLPPLKLPTQDHDGEGLAFISRTGKTSDVTKIKGWKNKFVQSKQSSDGSQKNMSAFCSNMLDEYLESEAQQISERAAAFSTGPEAPVAYQLPAKSASYVKTLDSALKRRKTTADIINKPCPRSFKPLLYDALTSAPPNLPKTATADACSASSSQSPAQASTPMSTIKSVTPPTAQQKLLEIENNVARQGRARTSLTPARVSASLAVILTKKMPQQQTDEVPSHPIIRIECGKEFCRLGCVCFSLNYPVVGPLHCRRPACMFGCSCPEQTTQDEATSGTNTPPHKPCSTSHSNKLWNRNIFDEDPDPLFQPQSKPVNPTKQCTAHPQQLIREEDKDPVYKYLESFLTCARVRPYNSKPPSQNKIDYIPTLATGDKARARPPSKPKKQENTVPKEKVIKKQIEIQSVCSWEKDRELILETLCKRLKQDKLSEPFNIGPYLIHPVTKIFIQKPSGSSLTYRVRISQPVKARNKAEQRRPKEEDPTEEDLKQLMQHLGVKLPFLGAVMLAGLMVARTKPVNGPDSELIQVNGKSYNNVNLLLGSMGSLHPANRLAAYATGRLHPRTNLTRRVDHTSAAAAAVCKVQAKPANENSSAKPATQNLNTTGRLLPLMMPVKNGADAKNHPLFQLLTQQCVKKDPESPPSYQPAPLPAVNPFQRSMRAPLTRPPSLKTPSFLSQSGTYSFRICPPSNPAEKDKTPPGITLPGGFKIIRLPSTEGPKDPPTSRVALEGTCNENVPAAMNGLKAIKDEYMSCSENCESSDYGDDDDESDVEDTIDIEAIDLSKRDVAVTRLDGVSQNKSNVLCTDKPVNSTTVKRQHHSDIEKQRRSEQRVLFGKLQKVLGQEGGSKLHLLSLALREIHMLNGVDEDLQGEKKKQLLIQALYLKKLSSLSGKPEELIKHNLNLIFSRLKDKSVSKAEPFFMPMRQPKGEPANDATSPPGPAPVQVPDPVPVPPLTPPPSKPSPEILPPPPLSIVPQPQPEAPSLPSPASPNRVLQEKSPPTPKPDHAPPTVVTAPPPKEVLPQPAQQFAIPVFRSKTGRLILPSSIKPGKGVYTLMLMNPQDADVPTQSSNTDSTIPLDQQSPPDAEPVDQDSPVQNGVRSVPPASPGKQVTPRLNSSPSPTRQPKGRPRGKPQEDKPFIPASRLKYQEMTRRRGRPCKNQTLARPANVGVALRPRTRGSLGKDFPSAKRQSWIDMEMQLDPDSDSDSDSE
ncbi:MAX gene-associated protein isoform X2 [Festucalex cinctus]